MAENNSHRKICVVWTTVDKIEDENGRTLETFTDNSKFYEQEGEKEANDLYEEILKKENTFCVSLCKILRDSEG